MTNCYYPDDFRIPSYYKVRLENTYSTIKRFVYTQNDTDLSKQIEFEKSIMYKEIGPKIIEYLQTHGERIVSITTQEDIVDYFYYQIKMTVQFKTLDKE